MKKAKISRKHNNVEIEIERGVEKYALRLQITVEQHAWRFVRARGYDVVCVWY